MRYLCVCLDGIRKEGETFSKGNQYTNRDPNHILPDDEVLSITCVLVKKNEINPYPANVENMVSS